MTRAVNENIAYIDRAKLAALLPEQVPIRKGKSGRLYLVAPWASWFMNTPAGQDALLEYGVFFGADDAPADVIPTAPPVAPVAAVDAPAANDEVEPVAANDDAHDKPKKTAGGFFDFN